jgi:hypothetical protein
MNLKELQAMIKEELDAYVNEQEVDVDVDAGDVDADGAESGDDSADILRKIYDMLKDKFEAEEEDSVDEEVDETYMDEEVDEEMMDEVKDDDKKDEAADMEERASQGFGDPGAKNTSGKDAGYTPAKTTKGDGKLHESVKRFQKLANIIK